MKGTSTAGYLKNMPLDMDPADGWDVPMTFHILSNDGTAGSGYMVAYMCRDYMFGLFKSEAISSLTRAQPPQNNAVYKPTVVTDYVPQINMEDAEVFKTIYQGSECLYETIY